MEQWIKGIATPVEGVFINRLHEESPHPEDNRSSFQHDRDRIIHSTPFRRLQYKTQVYMIHEGDLYRTRMTHTLEVTQIARALAQALNANSDLTEAIALAHDIGHPPFGHVGEKKIGELLKTSGIPFNHNIQSYRVVSRLEQRYSDWDGLNLCYAVYEGILRHGTYFDEQEEIKRSITDDIRDEVSIYWRSNQPGIEAQIVSMADIIAYASHDIEDALATGLMTWEDFKQLIIDRNIEFVNELMSRTEKSLEQASGGKEWVLKLRPRILARGIIDMLTVATIKQTKSNIEGFSAYSDGLYNQIREASYEVVSLPSELREQVELLVNQILFEHVYKEPRVMIMEQKARAILQLLFDMFIKERKMLPKNTQERLSYYEKVYERGESNLSETKILPTVVSDYLSGMTDKYAMDLYQLLSQPYEKAL